MFQNKFSIKEIEKYRLHLQNIRAEIIQIEKSYETEALGNSSDGASRVQPTDMGNDETIRDIDLVLAEHELRVIKMIDRAIERIRNGSFGICLECESEIPQKRLEIIPYTPYCVSCEEYLELEEQANILAHQRHSSDSSFAEPEIEKPLGSI